MYHINANDSVTTFLENTTRKYFQIFSVEKGFLNDFENENHKKIIVEIFI